MQLLKDVKEKEQELMWNLEHICEEEDDSTGYEDPSYLCISGIDEEK